MISITDVTIEPFAVFSTPVKAQRRAYPLRGRSDMRSARLRVRLHGGVAGGGVVRRGLAPRVHAARGVLLLQAAGAPQPRHLLGPHARARGHDGRLHHP